MPRSPPSPSGPAPSTSFRRYVDTSPHPPSWIHDNPFVAKTQLPSTPPPSIQPICIRTTTTTTPQTFFSTEEEIKAAGVARDLEVHLKFAPQAGFTQGRFLEYFVSDDARLNEAYDSITHGFTLPKDAAAIRKMGQHVSKKSTCALQFVTSEIGSWHRDQEHYDACAFLGKPFLFHSTESLVSKTIEHYRNLFQEDALIKKEGVASLSDFELYRIANRRLIARWEEELTRAQLEARLADWFTVTEVKEGEEKVPLRVIIAFQASYFRDPGFLEESLEILDQPGFASPLTWAKDAFERRVEFETGADAEAVCVSPPPPLHSLFLCLHKAFLATQTKSTTQQNQTTHTTPTDRRPR